MAASRWILAALLVVAAARAEAETSEPGARHFVFTYGFVLPVELLAPRPLDVFVPLPSDSPAQQIVREDVRSPVSGEIGRETAYGNRYWHARFDERGSPAPADARVELEFEVIRRPYRGSDDGRAPDPRFLAADERVVVGDPVLEPILAEIRSASPDTAPAARARAIYDWVVGNLEYKKVGTGWGNGDTLWACSERYGNCTDFHSLFISLARTEGIPARFEMGFPVPSDPAIGSVPGYHCWVEFHLPGRGWIPIDASEANKHPEKRDLLFGQQPPDRIQFSTGRDLRLGTPYEGPPLNYFIYPVLERGAEPVKAELAMHFTYRDAPSDAASGAPGPAR